MKPIYILLLGLLSATTALAAPQGEDGEDSTSIIEIDEPTQTPAADIPPDETATGVAGTPTETGKGTEATPAPAEASADADMSGGKSPAKPFLQYPPPYDELAKTCRPVTAGSQVRTCLKPFVYGDHAVRMTCPHWSKFKVPRFGRKKFLMNLEVYKRQPWNMGKKKFKLDTNFQVARYTTGTYPHYRECGWVRDTTHHKTLFDKCYPSQNFRNSVADPIGKVMMDEGFKPYIEKMKGWDWGMKLLEEYRRYASSKQCITLARYMAWEAGPQPL